MDNWENVATLLQEMRNMAAYQERIARALERLVELEQLRLQAETD